MQYQLKASALTAKTKGEIKRLRSTGYIPVSVQHRGDPTLHLMEETRQIQDFIQQHGQSSLLELVIEPGNERHNVMVHDVQRDPLTQKLIHVTYQKIGKSDEIHTRVSISFTGEPDAVKRGVGVVQHLVETVEIRCSQKYLPERFTIDISGLNIGDVVRAADIPHDSHVNIVIPADMVIVSLKPIAIAAPEPETEEAVPAASAPAEEAS